MVDLYEIRNTGKRDLEAIFSLFDHSILYQERNGYPVWKDYDKGAIIRDIENGNQYKIVIGSEIGIVFSVAYADKIIWRTMDKGDAIYLHRIVVNHAFKGHRLFGLILDWAIGYIKQKGLSHIRMDTWASNPTILNYYVGFGFEFVENYTTPDSIELPQHNRNLALTLLEYRVNSELS